MNRSLATCFLLLAFAFSGLAQSEDSSRKTSHFLGLQITTQGKGQNLVFIPGLNSSAEAFDEVCAAFVDDHRCHQLQLPGFAGLAPVQTSAGDFLRPMVERVGRYIRENEIDQPILVGHSLGGVVAMMLTLQQPALPRALVIVDSLPYYPAAQNPMASAEQMQPMALQMRNSITASSQQDYERRVPMGLMGMTRDQSRLPTLISWGKSTHKSTMAQAMYDMMTTDLRRQVANIKAPVLVLGSWAAYEPMGSTKEMTLAVFENQYQDVQNKRIHLSEEGFHFLMWDDQEWLIKHMKNFIAGL